MFFLFKKLHGAKSKRRVKLDNEFHQDLSWWRMFAEHFNSVSLCNVYETGLWVSVCDRGNQVRVAGLEFDDSFSLSYTPDQAVFYDNERGFVNLYLTGDMMGDTASREICSLWVFLMEHQDIADCTLIVFCVHKKMVMCMKKKSTEMQ